MGDAKIKLSIFRCIALLTACQSVVPIEYALKVMNEFIETIFLACRFFVSSNREEDLKMNTLRARYDSSTYISFTAANIK